MIGLRPTAGRVARRARSAIVPGGLVLMYHRIVDEPGDPAGIVVSPRHFAEQMEILANAGRAVPLADLVDGRESRTGRAGSVAVTFDDGYLDNLVNARPALERWGVPGTVFAVSGHIGRNAPFWWDELIRLVLRPGTLADPLVVDTPDGEMRWNLGATAALTEETLVAHRSWYADADPPPTPRHAAFVDLSRTLRDLPEERAELIIAQLRDAVDGDPWPHDDDCRCLSPDELVALAGDGLIEIGAHTVTHPYLPAQPPMRQRDEIVRSKRDLEEMLARPVLSFAFPYGGMTRVAHAAIRDAGFRYACSTRRTAVRRRTDPLAVPRIWVGDWDGATFERELHEAFRVC